MGHIDLCNAPTIDEVQNFISLCAAVANDDIENGRKKWRTGEELCTRFCTHWRNGHRRLASSVYRKTRWTLER